MPDKAQRALLWSLAVLLVVGTGLALRFARGYRPLAGLPASPVLTAPDVGVRFDKITMIGRENNRQAWKVVARRVETTRARSRFTFGGGVRASLSPGKDRPATTVTARDAVYDSLERRLRLGGGVVCRVRSLRVETSAAEWQAGTDVVFCPSRVRATDGRSELIGERLRVNIRTRELSLQNIRARFPVDAVGELPL
jgi:lipopolysaccharide export system protein LptC